MRGVIGRGVMVLGGVLVALGGLLVGSAAGVSVPAGAVSTTNTLTPSVDTQLSSASPTASYAKTTTLNSSAGSYLSLFRYDASELMSGQSGQSLVSVSFSPFVSAVASQNDQLTVYSVDAKWTAKSSWAKAGPERAQCSGTPIATLAVPVGATRVSVGLPVSAVSPTGEVNLCTSTSAPAGQVRIGSMESGTLPRLIITTSGAGAAPTVPYTPDTASTLFKLADPAITDASSWAVSRLSNGIRWTNQDRTHQSPQAYAIGPSGRDVATVTMTGDGMTNIDPEDLAESVVQGTPYVYVYDGGGNGDVRDAVYVHRFVEPALDPGDSGRQLSIAADTWTFTYPAGDLDGARTAGPDSEAILVNPATGQLFVIVKSALGLAKGTTAWGIYAAPIESASTPGSYPLTRIATTTKVISAATWSSDGSELALRTASYAYVYAVQDGDVAAALATTPLTLKTPKMPQSEGISFSADGEAVELSSEYHNASGSAPVVRQPLPASYYVAAAALT